jgi:sortase A
MTMTLTRPPEVPKAKRRRRTSARAPLLLVLAGALVLLYPVAATQFNNVKQHQFAVEYNQQVATTDTSELAADLERAEKYNAGLEGIPILDPWLTQVSGTPKSGPYADYLTELARFDAMGTVRVPSADIDLPIYHGTTDDLAAGRRDGHPQRADQPHRHVQRDPFRPPHPGQARRPDLRRRVRQRSHLSGGSDQGGPAQPDR